MAAAKDISGETFNYLTAVRVSGKRYRKGGRWWICDCVCGKQTVARPYDLEKGHIKSCGCMRKALAAQANSLPIEEAAPRYIFRNYRNNAKNRGYEFELSLEQFSELILANCVYCGEAPATVHTMYSLNETLPPRRFVHNGIDRVNNSDGYVSENCVSCCERCNRAKLVSSHQEFIEWLDKLAKFRISK